MAKIKDTDGASVPVGSIASVDDAVKLFGPDFVAQLAAALTPQLKRLAGGNVREAYQVEPYTGSHDIIEYVRTELIGPDGEVVINDKGKKQYKFVEQKRTVTGGWMVYFPQGHSLYIETADQLAQFKLNAPSGLVDMATGEAVTDEQSTIKDHVLRSTQRVSQRHSGDGSRAGEIDSVIASQLAS